MSIAARAAYPGPAPRAGFSSPGALIETGAPPAASEQQSSFGFWLLIVLLSLVAVGKVIQSDSMDPDAFWHLRVADQLVREGIHPLVDSISFASLKTPWTPYSWLAELSMQAVWNAGGFQLATCATAICSGSIIAMIAASSRRPVFEKLITSDATATPQPVPDGTLALSPPRGGGAELSVALLTAIAAFFTLPFVSFRPVTLALLILAVIVALLMRDRVRTSKATYLIVPLTVLMTNVHLYALLIPLLLAATTAGAWFDDRRRFKRIALLTIATAFAACCTPMLGGAVTTALRYNAVDPMVAANYITEMRPFYSGGTGKISLTLFAALMLTCVVRRRELTMTDWLWLILATTLLFRLGRFSPVFAIIATPVFAQAFPPLSGRALERGLVRVALITIIALALLNFWPSLRERDFDRWLNRNNPTYPTAAARFVETNVPTRTGRLINEFNWGGYLAWRLNVDPARDPWQVLMDGRTQLYAPSFWNATHLGTPTTRIELLKTLTADAAVLPADGSCLAGPLKQLGWTETYRDALAVVLTPPPGAVSR